MTPHPEMPSLEELVDEACLDALREGWTTLGAPESPAIFELEDVHLRIEVLQPYLRVSFKQSWPLDAGPPVETSETFQDLVRKHLSLDGDPARLTKSLHLSPFSPYEEQKRRESVELPGADLPIERLRQLAFLTLDSTSRTWLAEEKRSGDHTQAWVRPTPKGIEIEMVRTKLSD